jgi:hypothetical protein
MQPDGDWKVIRFVRMRDEWQPVRIYVTSDDAPIRPDWLTVVHARTWSRRRPEPEDAFVLSFLRDDGFEYEFVQCETLKIALDQARIIAGVPQSEWQTCSLKANPDRRFTWADVALTSP